MVAIAPSVSFPAMPQKEKDKDAPKTEQVNVRLKSATVERMDRYRERHPLSPTTTQIVEAAVADWLDKHEPELPKKPGK